MTIQVGTGSLLLSGELTIMNYIERLEEAKAALEQGHLTIDFANVQDIDSSAIAFMLQCVRISGGKVKFQSLPNTLNGLMSLYGVSDLLKTN